MLIDAKEPESSKTGTSETVSNAWPLPKTEKNVIPEGHICRHKKHLYTQRGLLCDVTASVICEVSI
jgi:hypothetical protein